MLYHTDRMDMDEILLQEKYFLFFYVYIQQYTHRFLEKMTISVAIF